MVCSRCVSPPSHHNIDPHYSDLPRPPPPAYPDPPPPPPPIQSQVEQSFELAPVRSMRELLEAELGAQMHQPGGLLADPSAAMGLLWARRGLEFWIHVFKAKLEEVCARCR